MAKKVSKKIIKKIPIKTNWEYCQTGIISELTTTKIKNAITLIIHNYSKPKIGETSNPNTRKYAYQNSGFKYFFFVYKSTSPKNVDYYESLFNTDFFDSTVNLKKGSAGKMPNGKPIYALYVATKRKKSNV